MDALRVGRAIRALRIRRGWRQQDLADAAGVSRSVICRIEAGALRGMTLGALEAVCRALEADLDVRVRWHAEALDRLLDEAHAGIGDRFVRQLRTAGWETAVEVTFNVYGDRGSVDVVGWQRQTRTILIAEIKSVVADSQGTLSPLDRKARLGIQIGRLRGWEPATVSKVLGIRDGSTNRRRIDELAATFNAELPMRAIELRRWLRSPRGSAAGLLFLPDVPQKSIGRHPTGVQRVNRPRTWRKPSQ
jgi:transcriptional regulator with XRE-family HTH domain